MTQLAKTARKTTEKPRIRPPLVTAVQLIVHEGLSITDAAQRVGYARESLSKALQKPHVVALKAAVRRAWLESETAKAWLVIAGLAENAVSEDVRLKAGKVILDAAGELDGSASGQARPPAGLVQIVVNHAGRAPELNATRAGVIEIIHDPQAMRDPGQADRAE